MASKFLIASPLFNTCLVVSLFSCSYHRLLVAKYGCKQEKSQEAKWRSTEERRPMHKMAESDGHGFIFGSSRPMGQGQPSLSYNPPQDVPTCHLQRTKGGRMSHLPRSLAAYAPAEPRGGHTHHSAGPAGDQQGGTP